MRWSVVTVAWLAATAIGVGPVAPEVTFRKADAGKRPTGWVAAKTGAGEGSDWAVVADPSAPGGTGYALAQTADGPTQLYNLCVADGSTFRDGEVSVMVKAVRGKIDQGGGVVWRYTDANNYYVCRYNPLEENFRVYSVKAGKRTQLATRENVGRKPRQWVTVSVKHVGNAIECSLDGQKLLAVSDDTFQAAGKVGVWSKADAVSHFDRFRLVPVP